MPLEFFSRVDCPLCEEAWQWLQEHSASEVLWRDIREDSGWEQRYGWSIPVLRLDDGREYCLALPEQREAAGQALEEL